MIKNKYIQSIILGTITTATSFLWSFDKGDFAGHGFPWAYYRGIWEMGMEWHISWRSLFGDILIWAIIWLLILSLISWLRKRAK